MLPRVCVTVGPDYGFDMDSMDPAFRRAMEGKAELLPLEVALASAATAPVVVLVCFAHSPVRPPPTVCRRGPDRTCL
jgi:hypothetical protein